MKFLDRLRERNLVQDVSDSAIEERLQPGDAFYVGFDPTSPNLHIGHLLQLITVIQIVRMTGMRPIILFGGATGAIGDPSGRNTERKLLERADIDAYVAAHTKTIGEILARAGIEADYVNNADWTCNLPVIDFLRDVGKHFTVNYMIAKEVVKTRLSGDGISFTEFSYMLIQANDFLQLYRTKGCKLQIGGSDQWGNITSGLELIRRKHAGEAFALSIPLLLDSSGKKFGKTSAGTSLWINADGMSPYRLHQFWLNTEDAELERSLKCFTLLGIDEITQVLDAHREAPEKRIGQTALADQVCTLVHGSTATEEAKRSAEILFGGKELSGIADETLLDIFQDVPSSTVTRGQVVEMSVLDLFTASGLVPSKGEGRRLIQSGGAYLNNGRVQDPALKVSDTAALTRALIVLRTGKKNYHLIRIGE